MWLRVQYDIENYITTYVCLCYVNRAVGLWCEKRKEAIHLEYKFAPRGCSHRIGVDTRKTQL